MPQKTFETFLAEFIKEIPHTNAICATMEKKLTCIRFSYWLTIKAALQLKYMCIIK